MKGKFNYILLLLISIAVAIHVLSKYPFILEVHYAHSFYPFIAKMQRIFFGWIPFSFGDLIYAALILLVFLYFIRWWKYQRKDFWTKPVLYRTFIRGIGLGLFFYILFNVSWGLNYNRRPLSKQFNMHTDSLTKEDVRILMQHLAAKMNGLYDSAHKQQQTWVSADAIFDESVRSYENLAKQWPAFNYNHPSVKASLFGILGNYMGYGGYYNPFTGEAQVNMSIFAVQRPFIACHEMAHQLGFAKENEANIVGFLAARASKRSYFQYSVYFELYAYAKPYLRFMDRTALKKIELQLRPEIKEEYRQAEKFYEDYHTPIDDFTDWLYSHFLRANQQPEGQQSYHRIVGWMIAYYKKYGIEAI